MRTTTPITIRPNNSAYSASPCPDSSSQSFLANAIIRCFLRCWLVLYHRIRLSCMLPCLDHANESGSSSGRGSEITVGLGEDLLDRDSHALNQNYDADHDQAEQQRVLRESLPRLVVPELLCELAHVSLALTAVWVVLRGTKTTVIVRS